MQKGHKEFPGIYQLFLKNFLAASNPPEFLAFCNLSITQPHCRNRWSTTSLKGDGVMIVVVDPATWRLCVRIGTRNFPNKREWNAEKGGNLWDWSPTVNCQVGNSTEALPVNLPSAYTNTEEDKSSSLVSIGSMGLTYLPTLMVDFYDKIVGKEFAPWILRVQVQE